MPLPIRLRPEAIDDLKDALNWYEARKEGLGEEFTLCVDAAMAELARTPFICQKVHGEVRRKLTRRFPYSIYFLVESGHIEVLAVFHTARNPRQWKRRSQS